MGGKLSNVFLLNATCYILVLTQDEALQVLLRVALYPYWKKEGVGKP
jgi:hypothetical protein